MNETKLMTLKDAVQMVVNQHGGIRAASRATGVDKAFISRLLRGNKTAPAGEKYHDATGSVTVDKTITSFGGFNNLRRAPTCRE